ncbi:MAG TPA: peptidoglycan DD-metalloendopeptidase family protein [Rhizomicrobium sp.]|nr:peptidoglycan DD-metalloendopeptidase family protein [Rhizomicrobium sp.]
MDRRSVVPRSFDLRRSLNSAAAALSTTDGRWAVVSTSITGLVAGSMAWLAASAMPPLHVKTSEASTTFLPYKLFTQLVQAGSNLVSGPGDAARQAAPPPAQLDRALADEENGDNGNPTPGIESRTLTLESGDTLAGVLEDAGVPSDDTNAAILALAKVYELRDARAGQSFTVTFESVPQAAHGESVPQVIHGAPPAAPTINTLSPSDEDDTDSNGDVTPVAVTPLGRLLSISFSPSVEHDITVARQADNSFVANDVVKQLVEHQHRAGATIDSSLYLAATQAGIPTDVTVAMIKMFSYKVDFQRDLRPGDSFEVYYSYYYTPDGQPARDGNIDYAVMRTGGREYALYRYQPDPTQPPDYFDAHGESVRGMLMKTPVDGARISSGFGMRFHPVLGYTRMHKGIDFAVPVGTPVMASGTGTVQIAGRSSGYGNYLRVNMGNGYGFAYGHLSRFAPGIHPGSHVHQGEIVAYSGNTGLSTGPHLHYETLVGGVQVNPLTLKIAQGRVLSGGDLRDFLIARLHTDAVLASTPLEAKVADVATDLRQAKAR